METKKLIGIAAAVLVVFAAVPFLPKILNELKGPDPAMDTKNLAEIRQAIDAYGQATGRYPTSLEALCPDYLAAVPKTHDQKAFHYDPRTGAVSDPAKSAANAQEPAGTGLTPAGDGIVGLSVHNELNF